MQWKPFCSYLALGSGGILASSEWIYWETLSLVIGSFGKVALSVHTIPTQVIMVSFMPLLSLGISLAIRLGATLPLSVTRAKRLTKDCYILGMVYAALFALLMHVERHTIYSWFTQSEAVLAGCEDIWWHVCFYFFQLGTFGVHMGACCGLGMQWTLGIVTLVLLWVVGLPAAIFVSVTLGGGLKAAWMAVWPPYVVINVILGVAILRADWEEIANQIRVREGMVVVSKRPSDIETQALVDHYGSTQNGR